MGPLDGIKVVDLSRNSLGSKLFFSKSSYPLP